MYNKVRVCGNILEVKATVRKNGNVRRGGGGAGGRGRLVGMIKNLVESKNG